VALSVYEYAPAACRPLTKIATFRPSNRQCFPAHCKVIRCSASSSVDENVIDERIVAEIRRCAKCVTRDIARAYAAEKYRVMVKPIPSVVA
jgi:hypothetical protein